MTGWFFFIAYSVGENDICNFLMGKLTRFIVLKESERHATCVLLICLQQVWSALIRVDVFCLLSFNECAQEPKFAWLNGLNKVSVK